MARIELKGTFTAIEPVQTVGDKGTLKQVIIFETKNVDEYGDQRGEAEQWQIAVMGNKIEEFAFAPNAIGKKAKLTVWVNSKRYIDKDNKIFYPVNLVLSKCEYAPVKESA